MSLSYEKRRKPQSGCISSGVWRIDAIFWPSPMTGNSEEKIWVSYSFPAMLDDEGRSFSMESDPEQMRLLALELLRACDWCEKVRALARAGDDAEA